MATNASQTFRNARHQMRCMQNANGISQSKHLEHAQYANVIMDSICRRMHVWPMHNRAMSKMVQVTRNGIIIWTIGANVSLYRATQVIQMTHPKQMNAQSNVASAKTAIAYWANWQPAVMSKDAKLHRACTRVNYITWNTTSACRFVR